MFFSALGPWPSALCGAHMSDINLTDEIKQMNVYWRLLAGLVNEGLGVIGEERLSPEARLERLRAKLVFARRYLRALPPSVKAELDANPRIQAAMADIAGRQGKTSDKESATYFVMG